MAERGGPDWTLALDDAMTERWGGCTLCGRWPLEQLVIREVAGLALAVSLCARCWRRDPTCQQVDALLTARYAPGRSHEKD